MPYISQSDAAILTAARDVLAKLAKVAETDVYDTTGPTGYRRGRFAEVCETGGDAVFSVLNVAANYLDDSVARQAIDGYRKTTA